MSTHAQLNSRTIKNLFYPYQFFRRKKYSVSCVALCSKSEVIVDNMNFGDDETFKENEKKYGIFDYNSIPEEIEWVMDQDCNVFPRRKKMSDQDELDGLKWVSSSCTMHTYFIQYLSVSLIFQLITVQLCSLTAKLLTFKLNLYDQ